MKRSRRSKKSWTDYIVAATCLITLCLGSYRYFRAKKIIRGAPPKKAKPATLAALQKGCRKGHQRSCAHLGIRERNGVGLPVNLASARDRLSAACEKADGLGCQALGIMYEKGIGVTQNFKEALAYFERSCQLNFARGCLNAGHMYRLYRGRKRREMSERYAKALRLGKAECTIGEGYGCFAVGWQYHTGRGEVRRNIARALSFYTRGCDVNHGLSCSNIGTIYDRMRGKRRYRKLAYLYTRKACRLHNPLGCYNISIFLINSHRDKKSLEEAYQTGKKSCRMHHGTGCYALGKAILNSGRWILDQQKSAKRAFERSCRLRVPIGCLNAGRLHAFGIPKHRSYPRALRFLERACHGMRSRRSCAMAGTLYRKGGYGLKKDCEKSNELYQKACRMGYPGSCALKCTP